MLGATPLSTGYDAHAVAKHQLSMAQAANAAVNLDLSHLLLLADMDSPFL